MGDAPKPSLTRVRLATWLFPPLGLVFLWRSGAGLGRKLFGILGIILFCVPYLAVLLFLGWRFAGLKFEMRGTPIPIPTFSPTVPDFARLEASRARQGKAAVVRKEGGIYWTDFRGPNRDGNYAEKPLASQWPAAGPKQLWRQPIGGGYASFVVAQGIAYTIEQRRDQEAVAAYELATGKEVWVHAYAALFQEWMGGDGPRATPTYHDGRIYSLGALGKLLWKHSILTENQGANLMYGMAGSPLIVDDLVIVQGGASSGVKGKTVLAYHRLTGDPVWQAVDDRMAYTSPMLVSLAGVRQLLVVGAARVMGLSPADGRVLWTFPWVVQYDNAISQPIVTGTNRFVISAAYGTGAAGVEIVKDDAGFQTRTLWRNKNLKNKFASSVLLDGYLYGLDEDILTCVDAATGERKWKDGRYGYGQLLRAGNLLVILGGEGDLALVKANPEKWEELARCPGIKGKTWNNPALADGKLLVRNSAEMEYR
jgi:outer membrane protein assembly factor BamB